MADASTTPSSKSPIGPADRVPVLACPLCGRDGFTTVGQAGGQTVVRCENCRLHLLNPQPSDAELVEIYHPAYSFFGAGPGAEACVSRVKQATAAHYLDQLGKRGITSGHLIEIGCGDGDFLVQALRRQFTAEGIDYSVHACRKARTKLGPLTPIHQGEIAVLANRAAAYDLCVACDVIEHVRQPAEFLHTVRDLLRPGGGVFIVTPNFGSWTARLMGSRWLEFKAEHLYYYTQETLQRQLAQAGFIDIQLETGSKLLSLDYVTRHFTTYPVPVIAPLLGMLRAILPTSWAQRPWLVPAGTLVALARKP